MAGQGSKDAVENSGACGGRPAQPIPANPAVMDVLLLLLHLAAWVGLALGLALPAARRHAVLALAVAALASGAAGLFADGERTLQTVHTYAGFEGSSHEVSMVSFPTGTFTAPGWQWPLPFVAFAVAWILVLRALGTRPLRSPLLLPLLFAWSATATWLGMQVLAAPALLVQPVGLDRFLWPAGLAGALLAAAHARRFAGLFAMVGAVTMLARLPAALASKLLSDLQLGTTLDVSSVRDIVNPMTQMQFEPRLEPGSGQQQFWLIWLEHVIFFPAVHLMSLLGIAFGAWIFRRHANDPA